MLKLVERDFLCLDPAGVAHGQLLVAGATVDADPAHHRGDVLLPGRRVTII